MTRCFNIYAMHYITWRHLVPAPQLLTCSTDVYPDHDDHVRFVALMSCINWMINMYEHRSLIASMQWAISLGRLDIKTAVILTLSFRRSTSLKRHPHRTNNVNRYKAGRKYKSVSSCTTIPNYSNLPKCNDGQNSLISINASLNIPIDATKSLNGHPVLFTQHVNAKLFHFWIYGRLETASLSLRHVDSTLYHPCIEWRTPLPFDLYLNELPTVEATIIAKHMSNHIVWGVTTFPQTWLGALLY
jgi:hypothetical protein